MIRKIRVDFGIPIEFEAEIVIPARGKDGAARSGVLCAYGTIKYSAADGATAPDGRLVYLKPTLAQRPASTVPYDVQAYANVCAAFPHESTVDQWFSESQFESYRALGDHVVRTLLGERKVASWDDLVTRVQAHLARHDAEQQPTGLALPLTRPAG